MIAKLVYTSNNSRYVELLNGFTKATYVTGGPSSIILILDGIILLFNIIYGIPSIPRLCTVLAV